MEKPRFNNHGKEYLSRRKLIAAGGALAFTPFLQACIYRRVEPTPTPRPTEITVKNVGILRTVPEEAFPVQVKNAVTKEFPTNKNVNRNYLQKLLQDLQNEQGNQETRVNTIKENIRILNTGNNNFINALRIDESGYYLTAAHGLVDSGTGNVKNPLQKPGRVINPYTGEINPITGIMIADEDIGLFFAPSGYADKPVRGLQIITLSFSVGKDLWMIAYLMNKDNNSLSVNGDILHGVVDNPAQSNAFPDQIRVNGMIPFGGSSGAPVIDMDGKVVGIESGYYQQEGTPPDDRKYITGARIIPVNDILELPAQGTAYIYYENGAWLSGPKKI